jgi:hypothetical protein
MSNNKQQMAVDYMESVAEELRLNGIKKVIVNGGTINISSLGVSMRYDCAYNPNVMADVYRCLSHLGTRIYTDNLAKHLQSIKKYKHQQQIKETVVYEKNFGEETHCEIRVFNGKYKCYETPQYGGEFQQVGDVFNDLDKAINFVNSLT